MRKFLSLLLPLLGAAGFIVFSELSLRRPDEFYRWSLATVAWILLVFAVLAFRRFSRPLLVIAVPAVVMIAVSTVTSLLFLDLVSPRHGLIVFFAIVLYLFLEHVRHEAARPNEEERHDIAEYARMVNIGSMFLIAVVSLGVTVFLPVPYWLTLLPLSAAAALWSWHLYAACTASCGRPLSRVLLTTLIVVETYLVVLRLPVSMFVGGALVGVVYYLAADLLPVGATGTIPPKTVRRHVIVGAAMIAILLLTARWSA